MHQVTGWTVIAFAIATLTTLGTLVGHGWIWVWLLNYIAVLGDFGVALDASFAGKFGTFLLPGGLDAVR